MIRIKRAYDPPERSDGVRVLVDRLWPRGLSRQDAQIHEWRRDLAPSDALRKWYGHDPRRWPAFRQRYRRELNERTSELGEIAHRSRRTTITLIFAAKDANRSNAAVLKSVLDRMAGP